MTVGRTDAATAARSVGGSVVMLAAARAASSASTTDAKQVAMWADSRATATAVSTDDLSVDCSGYASAFCSVATMVCASGEISVGMMGAEWDAMLAAPTAYRSVVETVSM